MTEDRCICCGAIIPEGNLACVNCLVYVKKEGSKDNGKTENVRDEQNLHPKFKSRSEKKQALHGRTKER